MAAHEFSGRDGSSGVGVGVGSGVGSGVGVGVGAGVGVGVGAGVGVGYGVGADSGIGTLRSYYATPIEQRYLPWTHDFTPDNNGAMPFPTEYLLNPYQPSLLEWTTQDWDPALRFWTLPYDPQLTEWLSTVDTSAPATLAAREFGGQPDAWHPRFSPQPDSLMSWRWLEPYDVAWMATPLPPPTYTAPCSAPPDPPPNTGWEFIVHELQTLAVYMEDDRQRYVAEADVQADGLADYIVHFIGADKVNHPWTIELVKAGLSIGNIAYMSYKAYFKRVRPSVLCPGLVPPFGPPAHPAFPSGHSFLAHFIALLLLEVKGIHERFGVLPAANPPSMPPTPSDGVLLQRPDWAHLAARSPIPSPLFFIANRIAVNRERIGVHYPSDSSASRHLAAGLWDAMMPGRRGNPCYTGTGIDVPTLHTIIDHARSEWVARGV